MDRLGFVQADPIRAPATAQDLILRHRVLGYRAGDLERQYEPLELEEEVLYAYGFVPRSVRHLLHPRRARPMSELERKVLTAVRRAGRVHPRELEAQLGGERVVNAWGGHSKATTEALESLHLRGHLRVARRERGIKVYEPALAGAPRTPTTQRLRQLVLGVATVLAPVQERRLRTIATGLCRRASATVQPAALLRGLYGSGELERLSMDGVVYAWPASSHTQEPPPRRVRFLAPFDPVVWDRRRFEHLWGWEYRFEAYTPPAKRVRGYYAMPLLWCDRVIGWANASIAGGKLQVELGFDGKRPRDRDFSAEAEAEIARLEACLEPGPPSPLRKSVSSAS